MVFGMVRIAHRITEQLTAFYVATVATHNATY